MSMFFVLRPKKYRSSNTSLGQSFFCRSEGINFLRRFIFFFSGFFFSAGYYFCGSKTIRKFFMLHGNELLQEGLRYSAERKRNKTKKEFITHARVNVN